MFGKLIATWPTWAALPLRIALGIVFIGHGLQKVFGMWGGPGLDRFTSNPAPFSWMQPASLWMSAAAFAELVGGVLVLLGFLTRLGALMILPVMLVAVFAVHWGAFFMSARGIEYAFTLSLVAVALLVLGGGRASVDEMLFSGGRGRRR